MITQTSRKTKTTQNKTNSLTPLSLHAPDGRARRGEREERLRRRHGHDVVPGKDLTGGAAAVAHEGGLQDAPRDGGNHIESSRGLRALWVVSRVAWMGACVDVTHCPADAQGAFDMAHGGRSLGSYMPPGNGRRDVASGRGAHRIASSGRSRSSRECAASRRCRGRASGELGWQGPGRARSKEMRASRASGLCDGRVHGRADDRGGNDMPHHVAHGRRGRLFATCHHTAMLAIMVS